jgi:hypothetical protein
VWFLFPILPVVLTSSANGETGISLVPSYCRQKLGLVDGLSGRVFERSELSATPSTKVNFWKQGNIGCLFLWFVSFGQTKEMNAPRQRG